MSLWLDSLHLLLPEAPTRMDGVHKSSGQLQLTGRGRLYITNSVVHVVSSSAVPLFAQSTSYGIYAQGVLRVHFYTLHYRCTQLCVIDRLDGSI